MALYTDSDHLTEAALVAIDPEVPDVAAAETITVADILRATWDECANTLLEKLDAFGGQVSLLAGVGAQSNTLLNYGMGVSRSRVFLTQIVISAPYALRTSALERWMLYCALANFYRAASNRRGHDRYEEKHDRFETDSKKHWRSLATQGLPVVLQPLPCPGAIHELHSGAWGPENVSSLAGGAAPSAMDYEIAITWVDQTRYLSPSSKGNAESGPSAKVTYTLPANELLTIDITSLNPPTGAAYGSTTFAYGSLPLLAASGWNVYIGAAGGPLFNQTLTPIPVSTKTFTISEPQLAGFLLDPGQLPDASYAFINTLQRA